MITTDEKLKIKDALQAYCEQKGSQNKAANSLNGVSSATISKLLSEDWELINEVMWRSIAAQIGYKSKAWNVVETRNFKDLMQIFSDAQEDSLVMAVKGESGWGKTEASNAYAEANKNVYVLKCKEYWNRKVFMQELLKTMGKSIYDTTVSEMMNAIVYDLKRMNTPLIIMDEVDKLSDQVLYFFISLYNDLEHRCGIVILSTDYFEKRIRKGLRLNKRGYKEIHSRLDRSYIPLEATSLTDITGVCIANGITDKKTIKEIAEDSEGDLRRVRKKIYAIIKKSHNESLQCR